MKRSMFFLSLLFLASGCKKDLLHWQTTEKISTHTSEDRLNKIFFIDDKTGFIIGGTRFTHSVILKTGDGGDTWSYYTDTEANKSLFGITLSPSGSIYAIGFDGKLLRSPDQGSSWQFSQVYYEPYKDLAFIDINHGILIGGISFKTGYLQHIDSEGHELLIANPQYELNDIEMIDNRTGYISGYGVVQKTADSGYSWTIQDIHNDNFTAIHAYGPHEAWTCGYNGSIFHTADGGDTWQRMRNGNDVTLPRYRLLDIAFTDAVHGYAIGEQGLVIHTDDAGRHWMEFDRFTNATLRCILPRKDGSFLVCGDNGSLYKIRP